MSSITKLLQSKLPSYHIEVGDVRAGLAMLPDNTIQCVVTSPPYYGLRSYNTNPQVWGGARKGLCDHTWESVDRRIGGGGYSDKSTLAGFTNPNTKGRAMDEDSHTSSSAFCTSCGAWCGELGSEPTVEMFVDNLVEVFAAVKRVLRDDGVLWLNVGDSYTGSNGNGYKQTMDKTNRTTGESGNVDLRKRNSRQDTLPEKNLCLIPERLAIALQDDGWYIRSCVAWCKKSAMPESVTDRPSSSWEHVWMCTKKANYYYDSAAVRQEAVGRGGSADDFARSFTKDKVIPNHSDTPHRQNRTPTLGTGSANLRNTWILSPEPFSGMYCGTCGILFSGEALGKTKKRDDDGEPIMLCPGCGTSTGWISHYAAYPTELAALAIKASTSEYGACDTCGAPWRRRIDHKRSPVAKTFNPKHLASDKTGLHQPGWQKEPSTSTTTTGWEPSCKCIGSNVIPCLVLDPFMGSGSTAIAALRNKRRVLGTELSPVYADMAEQRIRYAMKDTGRRPI